MTQIAKQTKTHTTFDVIVSRTKSQNSPPPPIRLVGQNCFITSSCLSIYATRAHLLLAAGFVCQSSEVWPRCSSRLCHIVCFLGFDYLLLNHTRRGGHLPAIYICIARRILISHKGWATADVVTQPIHRVPLAGALRKRCPHHTGLERESAYVLCIHIRVYAILSKRAQRAAKRKRHPRRLH